MADSAPMFLHPAGLHCLRIEPLFPIPTSLEASITLKIFFCMRTLHTLCLCCTNVSHPALWTPEVPQHMREIMSFGILLHYQSPHLDTCI